jgi:hypothetical protein
MPSLPKLREAYPSTFRQASMEFAKPDAACSGRHDGWPQRKKPPEKSGGLCIARQIAYGQG